MPPPWRPSQTRPRSTVPRPQMALTWDREGVAAGGVAVEGVAAAGSAADVSPGAGFECNMEKYDVFCDTPPFWTNDEQVLKVPRPRPLFYFWRQIQIPRVLQILEPYKYLPVS